MAHEEVQKGNSSAKEGISGNYFSESLAELKKVTTPTRQEAMQATLVTIFIMLFMAVCLFFLDWFFHTVVSFLII